MDEVSKLILDLRSEAEAGKKMEAQPDGVTRLCAAVYGRKETVRDWVGGSEAKMLYDAADEIEQLRAELDATLKDWNAIVTASGSPTHGAAVGHVATMKKKIDSYLSWQPIETAPTDGSHVRLYRPHSVFVGYYGGANFGWRVNAPGLPSMCPLPTHWAELPPMPPMPSMDF